jgi:hypothetical protein
MTPLPPNALNQHTALAQTAAHWRNSASLAKRRHKKTKISKSHKKKKKEKDKDKEPKKNTCPHCKKYHRKKSHRVELDECMWNKKYKGYRFKSICNELKVAFKPRITLTVDLDGYAAKEDSGSK